MTSIKPHQTQQGAPGRDFQPPPTQTTHPPVKEEIHTPRGWAYFPPKSCCEVNKLSKEKQLGNWHSQNCEAGKEYVE